MAWLRLSLAEAETENPHAVSYHQYFTKTDQWPVASTSTSTTPQVGSTWKRSICYAISPLYLTKLFDIYNIDTFIRSRSDFVVLSRENLKYWNSPIHTTHPRAPLEYSASHW